MPTGGEAAKALNHSSDLFLCHLKGTGRASAAEAGKFRTWSEFETGHRLIAPVPWPIFFVSIKEKVRASP